VRLLRPSLAGWATAIGALALLMGLIARQAGEALGATASLRRALARLGAPGGGAAQYLGLTFLMIALLVALVAASQVSAARGEEAGGRLDALLCQPLSRGRWLAGRAGIAVAALIAGGLLAGLLSWAAAASQQAGVALPRLLAAGLNTVPPALCVLGAGILALGLVPRAAAAVTYGVIAWSLLIELAGGVAGSSHWLLDTSVFHQMIAAPAVSPDWASAAVLTAVGLAAALAGGLAFARRDLSGA
jgi:ABC-2 type transport system permease protein